MHGVVLGRRDDLEILRVVTLQSFHKLDTQPTREVRVFAVSLLPASPARVAEDVDVRRPESQAEEARAVAAPLRLVILGARFSRDNVCDAADETRVEGCAEANGLRED